MEGPFRKSRVSKLFHQFSFRKACFHYYWNTFSSFLSGNIHACCNQQIYSFMWFTFYQKMIYYEISFPLTFIFKYNFVKFLLLITSISISVSLRTSDIPETWQQPSPPPSGIFMQDLKISDQNNWRGPEQKIKSGGEAKFKGGPKVLGGGYKHSC